MVKKVGLSGEERTPQDIDIHHQDTEQALRHYFATPQLHIKRFFGYTQAEIQQELQLRIIEQERMSSLELLAALEAIFRLDYLQRGLYSKQKDQLSKHFRSLYKEKEKRVSLEEDIFEAWKIFGSVKPELSGDLKGAFKYRHWLAHGRYWTPKTGRKYDYFGLQTLTTLVLQNFPFQSPHT